MNTNTLATQPKTLRSPLALCLPLVVCAVLVGLVLVPVAQADDIEVREDARIYAHIAFDWATTPSSTARTLGNADTPLPRQELHALGQRALALAFTDRDQVVPVDRVTALGTELAALLDPWQVDVEGLREDHVTAGTFAPRTAPIAAAEAPTCDSQCEELERRLQEDQAAAAGSTASGP